ncbi:uncharacterized protein M6B38_385570 [Iris pallida]|uniref:Uncharacterized protein n=1 Tax=Iris pallida TaxID=29817 RepID=A0AAX6G2Y0_IRIPA|nr:uncharacterized protein M6B38_385570 [Iris pallida]
MFISTCFLSHRSSSFFPSPLLLLNSVYSSPPSRVHLLFLYPSALFLFCTTPLQSTRTSSLAPSSSRPTPTPVASLSLARLSAGISADVSILARNRAKLDEPIVLGLEESKTCCRSPPT